MQCDRRTSILSGEGGAKPTAAMRLVVRAIATLTGLVLTLGLVPPSAAAPAPVVLIVMQNKGLKRITAPEAP